MHSMSSKTMTINQLWGQAMPGVKKKSAVNFDTASNQRIAIDFNCWFYGSCAKPQNALPLNCNPSYPPTELIKTLSTWHQSMLGHNVTPYYVFDGRKHPMKRNTHLDRCVLNSLDNLAH